MFRVLTISTYRRLFGAQVVSLLGTGLATVSLGLLAYDLAGAQASVVLGTIFMIKMVAYVGIAPLAAAALVSAPRQHVLVGADLIRVVTTLALPLTQQVWQVLALIVCLQAASATFTPTFQAVIPLVLPDEEDYTNALSLSRLAYDLEAILSPLLAALLLTIIPGQALFIGTALGFLGSAFLVIAAALPKDLGIDSTQAKPDLPFGKRARAGMAAFITQPALRPLLALDVAVAATGAFVIVQTVVITRGHFGMGEAMVAVFLGCSGAGSMVSALALPRWLPRLGERRVMLTGALIVVITTAGAALALWGPATPITPYLIGGLWFVHGLGWSAIQTPIGRILRRETPIPQLPGVFAARFSLSHAAWLWAYPLCGFLGSYGLAFAAGCLALIAAFGCVVASLLWAPVSAYHSQEGLILEDSVAHTPQDIELDYAAEILRLLADRTRLAILAMLDEGELSVSTIAERLNRPLPAVSQHLAKLRTAGLVSVRKEGTTSFYSQPDAHLASLVTNALHYSEHHFNPNPLHHRIQH